MQDYYQRFDPEKGYEQLLFRSGKGLQSAELNDMQAQVSHQVKGIADVLLKDGDVVLDGEPAVNSETGLVQIGASSVYLRGQVRTLAPAELVIATDQIIDIGVWLSESQVTELEDPSLRDPAVSAHNYDEPGAARLKVTCQWGLASDSGFEDANFYPVYRIDKGVLIIKQPPPQLDAVTVALARYDRESNGGSYVVDGMNLTYRDIEGDYQVYSLEEGKAHIQGYEVSFPTSRRELFDYDPDKQLIEGELHVFTPDESGDMRIDLAFSPVNSVSRVDANLEKTVTVTHSAVPGGMDPLPDVGVFALVSVTQNETVYQEGIDFTRSGNQVNWGLGGNEPQGGESYQVTYQFREQLAVTADETGFTLSQAQADGTTIVANSALDVDYDWSMNRIDLMVLDQQGQVQRIKGLSNSYEPTTPVAPANQLVLAQIRQNWFSDGKPEVTNLAVRSVPMATLEEMQQQISDLYDLVAIERLRNDANAEEPAAKLGVFVDPFLDDDMRDSGLAQTAAIIDGELMLPVDVSVTDLPLPSDDRPVTLNYQLEAILEQTMKTGKMKVNPYQAFSPIPATVKLTPAVDHWTQTTRVWTSPVTRWITRGWRRVWRRVWNPSTRTWDWGWGWGSRTTRSDSVQTVSVSSTEAEFLRVRQVNFEITGFGPGEKLEQLMFDGSDITSGAS
ncbi:DUF4815 domain-containing protein [Thalassomonas viridans]|uniref:DUF4815 domain-containing protein n=1 Tax=Thalassomonas viridans TaxID=137584 RepID=A0AAE9Z162_9GAMM|nr:DUF4815 domain-containing protein [Thalassomonas viridans]WDE04668.1 DUF4815 domain-containing protein [Thalassomonas viridans]